MSTDVQITLGVLGFFLILALLTFMRLALRKQPPSWRAIRFGVFVERLPRDGEIEPLSPTTYQRPIKKEEA